MNSSAKKIGFFLFFAVLLFGAVIISKNKNSPNTTSSSAGETAQIDPYSPTAIPPQTIEITAQNDTFDPKIIDLLQYQDTLLKINAVDKDYQFILPEFEITALAPQGRITEVLVPGKAIGIFTFTCGDNCSGEIQVADNDADTEYE